MGEKIQVPRFRSGSEAGPAPFVLALLAPYLVVTTVSASQDFALRARLHSVIGDLVDELIVSGIFAADSTVRGGAALHANFLAAVASACLIENATFPNVVEASVPRAPAQVGVHVDVDVELEPGVLLSDFF